MADCLQQRIRGPGPTADRRHNDISIKCYSHITGDMLKNSQRADNPTDRRVWEGATPLLHEGLLTRISCHVGMGDTAQARHNTGNRHNLLHDRGSFLYRVRLLHVVVCRKGYAVGARAFV